MATSTVTPDPETMDLNALRLLAEEEARKATTTQPEKKVVSTTTTTEEIEVEEEDEQPETTTTPKQFVAERSFDLGDGAGHQVFKGKGESREDALEDLADKLAEAQRNATKRIKELKTAKPEPKGPTKEEESIRAAKIITTPSEVVKDILGIDPSELQELVAEGKQTRALKQRKAIADEFVVKHPEFLDNARNGQRLAKAIALQGEFTLENFEKAYQDLSESGLLEVKGEEAGGGQIAEEVEQQRIVAEAKQLLSSQRTRKSSGISTHRTTTVTKAAEPTEDEMYSMSLEELGKRANKQLAG